MPVAPLGSWAVLPPTTLVASGSVVPSADPTDEPLGHCAAAVAAVAVGAATVGVALAAPDDDVALVLDPPQAASAAANVNAVSGIQSEELRVTWGALRLNVEA